MKGEGYTPSASLYFSWKDKLGHVQIEVFMELGDDEPISSHTCCFFVNTELGLLEKFSKNVTKIKEEKIGYKVKLI